MENEKISAVISSLEGGGAENNFLMLVEALVEWGHSVHVITILPGEKSLTEKLPHGITHESLNLSGRGEKGILKGTIFFKIVSSLRKIFRERKSDRIISFMDQTNILCLIASLGLSMKRVVAVRVHPEFSPFLKGFLPKTLLRSIRDRIYSMADRIIIQSETMKEFYPNFLQEKIRVVPNTLRSFREITDASPSDPETTNILTVGRLVPQKNHKLLIHAFSHIVKSYPETTLTIVGSGPLKDELEALVSELHLNNKIHISPKVDEIERFYLSASLFVLTSHYEGFPNVLIEAMSFGIPVITTDAPGASREIVGGGEYGLLIPCNDKDALIAAMEEVISKKEELATLGSRGQNSIVKRYSPHVVFPEWRAALND